jgi:CrcB protein
MGNEKGRCDERMNFSILLWTLVGGMLGALARYYLGLWLTTKLSDSHIPLPILLINSIGGFCLGAFVGLWGESSQINGSIDPNFYSFLTIGFCGSFTTFSTFSVEVVLLLQKNLWKVAIGYIVATVVMTMIGFLMGLYMFM